MEIINKEIIRNSNNFYIDIINNLLFTPNIFINRNYLKDLIEDMENRLINDKIDKNEQFIIKLIIGLCNEKLEEFFHLYSNLRYIFFYFLIFLFLTL